MRSMAADRAFDEQFQWEVDRWVFRNRHRGEPIEVTREERDRLIALHRDRLATWSRVVLGFCGVAFCVISFWFDWLLALVAMPFFYYLGTVATMPVFLWSTYADVPRQVKGRPLLGMPLGQRGRLARKAGAFTLRELAWSTVVAIIASVASTLLLVAGETGGQPVLAFAMCLPIWIATIACGRMTVLRWAQLERDRRHKDGIEDLHRARDLRPE